MEYLLLLAIIGGVVAVIAHHVNKVNRDEREQAIADAQAPYKIETPTNSPEAVVEETAPETVAAAPEVVTEEVAAETVEPESAAAPVETKKPRAPRKPRAPKASVETTENTAVAKKPRAPRRAK